MVNLAVPYSRANYALQTLVAEVKAKWGNPARHPEFVTGYKAASNLTGHNADNNGVCHAVDLFFSNGSAWTEDRGWELAEWLRTVEGPRGAVAGLPDRVAYIIYRDRIAGHHTGWRWAGSGYGHWDHIHVSTCDMYWGDPAPKPPGDYDTRAPWGFASGTLASASTITPITIKEDELSKAFEDDARGEFDELRAFRDDVRGEFNNLRALDVDLRGDLAQKGQQIAALTAANEKLVSLLADSKSLSVDDVRAALAGAIKDGIKVSIGDAKP